MKLQKIIIHTNVKGWGWGGVGGGEQRSVA